jgi:hypothetical protein
MHLGNLPGASAEKYQKCLEAISKLAVHLGRQRKKVPRVL